MIYISYSGKSGFEKFIVLMPHEINNQFLGTISRMSHNKQIPYNFTLLGVSDFGNVIIPSYKLDEYILQLDTLKDNLDDVLKYHPLPKTIWGFDLRRFENYKSLIGETENGEIEVSSFGVPFSKKEMLVFLNILKEKVLEAKSYNADLRFLGD